MGECVSPGGGGQVRKQGDSVPDILGVALVGASASAAVQVPHFGVSPGRCSAAGPCGLAASGRP